MKNNLFDDDTFLARWMAGELSEEEQARFRQHPDYAFYQQVAEETENLRLKTKIDRDSLLQSIKSQAQKTTASSATIKAREKRSRPIRALLAPLLAAAIALLLIGYFAFFRGAPHVYLTASAEQQMIQLPDGSSVVLNANSELIRPASDFENNRQVQLNGEAFFTVKEGTPFSVQIEQGEVSVLGTEFSVYSRGQHARVACKSGSVQVENNAGKTIVLLAGERIYIYQDRLSNKDTIPPESIATWRKGVSSFESEHLNIVAQAIENQFDISIKLPSSLHQERFTGSFLHDNLETAMKMVFDPMNLSYRKIDEQQWEVIQN